MAHLNPPFTIALTGGIASGKTLVSDAFNKLGVPVIDTDIIAHQIVEPGQPALLDIECVFGTKILDENGRLKRRGLRELIFKDAKARKMLESILHPKIRKEVSNAIAEVKHDYCILVIPLLAESGAFPGVKRVLVIDVDPETQITRLMARDNTSRGQALQALASQTGRAQRLAIADDILENQGSEEDLLLEVKRLHRKYMQLASSACHDSA